MSDTDIEIKQGSRFSMGITFTDETTIAGFEFRGQIRKSPSDATVQAAFLFLDGSADNIKIAYIGSDDTSLIPAKSKEQGVRETTAYVYDIEYLPVGGDTDNDWVRLLQGTATVSPEVTRE